MCSRLRRDRRIVASSPLVPLIGWLQSLGIAGYLIAALLGIWLIISILRSGKS